ncbi:hypothetical protein GCM10023341_23250 [Ornithinimicrobium tianjinense]
MTRSRSSGRAIAGAATTIGTAIATAAPSTTAFLVNAIAPLPACPCVPGGTLCHHGDAPLPVRGRWRFGHLLGGSRLLSRYDALTQLCHGGGARARGVPVGRGHAGRVDQPDHLG